MITDLQDYFAVAIDCKYEESKTKSGIILLNTAYVDDTDMDRYTNKRIYGTVVAAPRSFSNNPYRAIDDGKPNYRKYIGHDDIVDKINRGYRNHAEKTYYPSTFDAYDVVTYADIAQKVDVKIGDTVYFTPQTTEPENYLGKHKGKDVYRVIVSDLWCSFRDDQAIMQGEWVLVKPNKETWEDITTPAGVIKKPRPDAKYLEGFIAHSKHDHLSVGTKIIYIPNADCDVKIRDEEYFIMPAQDILGELTN
jgi:co-chaperonin GroES (HSP10)